MLNQTFKRGQVEWAIWAVHTQQRAGAGDAPSKFSSRLKRLLELDRYQKRSKRDGAGFAFSAESQEGSGSDAFFTPYEAFSLALALELLDAGFKPSDIISLLQRERRALERQFNAISRDPPPPKPADSAADSTSSSDKRVFMILPATQLDDVVRYYVSKKAADPAFSEIKFCRGIKALSAELGQMRHSKWSYRRALTVEIAYLVTGLSEVLPSVPLTKRGRKSFY